LTVKKLPWKIFIPLLGISFIFYITLSLILQKPQNSDDIDTIDVAGIAIEPTKTILSVIRGTHPTITSAVFLNHLHRVFYHSF